MHLKLALVLRAHATGCTLRWLNEAAPLAAGYSASVRDRVKIRPGQLVVVDVSAAPPAVLWRWCRGPVVYRQADYVVVDNRLYQPGFRFPISIARVPDALEVDVVVGDEVFYSLGIDGVVVDSVVAEGPAHPARIAADLFPALADVYAELGQQEQR